MLTIGNDKMESNKDIGDFIECPHCGGSHNVDYGEEILSDGTRKPSKLLAFYKCGDSIYLAGIRGKAI